MTQTGTTLEQRMLHASELPDFLESAQLAPECGFERAGAHRGADSVSFCPKFPRQVAGNLARPQN